MAKPKRTIRGASDKEPASPKQEKNELSYGDASARLEEILQQIEDGQVDIDELSGLVKEAAGLVTLCRKKIHAAQVQVEKITEQLERDAPFADEGGAENDEEE
jgi:exodeoxyribonuclease VII small subunit